MLKSIITVLKGKFASLLITFFIGIITSRFLQPEGKGIYSLFLLISSYLLTFSDIGISSSSVYYVGKYRNKSKSYISSIMGVSIILSIITLIIFTIFLFCFNPTFIKNLKYQYIFLLYMLLPLNFIYTNFRHVLLGKEEFKLYNNINILQVFMLLVFLLVTIISFSKSTSYAIYSFILSILIASVILVYWHRKEISFGLMWHVDRYKELLCYGYKVYLINIFNMIILRLDSLIISNCLSIDELGFYSVAVSLVEMMWQIPNIISLLLFSKSANSKSREMDSITPTINRIIIALTLIASIVLYIISKYIIVLLYSASYQKSVGAFKLLLPGVVMYSVFQLLYRDMCGRGKPEVATLPIFISSIFTIILDFLLIPKMGINGAALASTITYTIASLILIIKYIKITGIRIKDLIIVNKNDIKYLQSIRILNREKVKY